MFLSSDSDEDETSDLYRHEWEGDSPPPLPPPLSLPYCADSSTATTTAIGSDKRLSVSSTGSYSVSSDVLREAAAYHRRSMLLQGLYGLNRWVLRGQSAASMTSVLNEYRKARMLRMALCILRVNALL